MKLNILIAMLAAALLIAVTGCSKSEKEAAEDAEEEGPELISVYPHNDMRNVPPDTLIYLRFDTPMDTASVRRAFHMMGGSEIQAWMDSLGHHHGMDGRMTGMGHMMAWMNTAGYHGQLHWNADLDSCWFRPDQMMVPNADQVIYIYGDVKDSKGEMMMQPIEYGGRLIQFHTGPKE